MITCSPDMSIDDCAQMMERHQVRRIPVIDRAGTLCGMVALATEAAVASRRDLPLGGRTPG